MPIEFRCSQCDRLLRVPDESAGRRVKCGGCGAVVPVPTSSVPPTIATPPGPAASPHQALPQSTEPPAVPVSPAVRVAGPAIALMIVGVLNIIYSLFSSVANLFAFGAGRPQGLSAGPFVLGLGLGFMLVLLIITLSAAIVYGAMRMKTLEDYKFALAASIMAMIPCFFPCCLLGIPLGIWSLTVLNDPNVKAAFRS